MPPGLRNEEGATREGGAVRGEWGGGRGPGGERATPHDHGGMNAVALTTTGTDR